MPRSSLLCRRSECFMYILTYPPTRALFSRGDVFRAAARQAVRVRSVEGGDGARVFMSSPTASDGSIGKGKGLCLWFMRLLRGNARRKREIWNTGTGKEWRGGHGVHVPPT